MVFMHVVVLHRDAVRALATRRAREAIQQAQERLRAASHALPDRLVPLIKIINYGRTSAGGCGDDPASAGVASAETAGGTGRVGGTGPLAGLSTALSEFTGRAAASPRTPTAAEAAEGPLSVLLQDEPCAFAVVCGYHGNRCGGTINSCWIAYP